MRDRASVAAVLAALASGAAGFAACSSGGSHHGFFGASNGTMVGGTAAVGAPLASATITFEDAKGNSVVTTADSTGAYTADVSGLGSPILIRAVGGGKTLYSVGAQLATGALTTANVDPVTDLIVRAYYSAQGLSIDTVFASPTSTTLYPSPSEVATIAGVVRANIAAWFVARGLDPIAFDPISTGFAATASGTATGFDSILDELTISGSTITITDGTTTSTMTITASAGTISCASTIVSSAGTTTIPTVTASVQSDPAAVGRQQAAVDGVLTLMRQWGAITSRTNPVATSADYLPLFDANYLSDGQLASNTAAIYAMQLAGSSLTVDSIDRVFSFHDDPLVQNQTINVIFTATFSRQGNAPATVQLASESEPGSGYVFKGQSDGTWKFYGDQLFSDARAGGGAVRVYGAPDSLNQGFWLEILPAAITSVTVSGPGLTGAVDMVNVGPGDAPGTERWQCPVVTPFEPAGSAYTFTFTPTPGQTLYPTMPASTFTQVAKTFATTTEFIDIVQYALDGGALVDRSTFHALHPNATDLAGHTLTVVFTAPTTFAVNEPALKASAGGGGLGGPGLPRTPQNGLYTGTVNVPSSATSNLQVSASCDGFNGESTKTSDTFP